MNLQSQSSDKTQESDAGPYSQQQRSWIAEVSHELRLPLANIKLLVETLIDGAVEDPVTAMRMLKRTQREVERLEALVVDLLSVEDVKSRRDDIKRQVTNLKEAADYAIESTRALAEKRRIAVKSEISDVFKVNSNPDQLNQVLLNLVENAIKYTPEGGEVWIRSGDRAGVFTVEDNGIGIASEDVSKIFKRFYRVDRSRAPGSTGLGLSIVKHIADLHDAKISVKSKPGEGSSFTLEFPHTLGSGEDV